MPVRTIVLVVSSTPVAPIPSHGITPTSQPVYTLFNHVDARPLFVLSMPMNNKKYPHGMPMSMMVCLHTNKSTFSDNAMATGPSHNAHNSSSSTINNMV